MHKLSGAVSIMTAVCALHAVQAEVEVLPDMVVTPSGYEMEAGMLGHSVTLITEEDIRSAGWRSLPEALRTVPGLYVSQSGAPGSTVSLSIRGSRTAQVLVLIDGVRLNDPSGPTREAEIQSIDLSNVERIEVVRGPLSGLYGSDATAGVIHVITKRGEPGVRGSVFAEAGSYATYRVGGQLVSGTETTQVSVDATYLQSDGFSAANERLPGNTEDDGVESWNLRVAADHQLTEQVRLDAHLHYIDTRADYDDGAGPFADADNQAETEQVLTGVGVHVGERGDFWQQSLQAQYSRFDRSFRDSFGRTTFDGEHMDADWRHTLAFDETHHVTFGVNVSEETGDTMGERIGRAQTLGVYAQDQISIDAFSLLAGARYDYHDEFGDAATWRVAPSYRFDETGVRFKGSVGTGFKAPSLYQLYAPEGAFGPVGNVDLDPERSLGWDAGVEQVLLDGMLVMDMTFFSSTIKDQIDFVVGYENVSRVETEGVELSVLVSPMDTLDLTASYTYTKAEDKDSGTRLIRVPRDRAALRSDWRPMGGVSLTCNVRYVGAFDDRYFDMSLAETQDVRVDSSIVVDVAGAYDVSERVQLFGRIDNVFDETYEEIAGFGTAGLSGYGGVRVAL